MTYETLCLLQPFISFHLLLRFLHLFGVLDDVLGSDGYRTTRHSCSILIGCAEDLLFGLPIDEERPYFVRNGVGVFFVTDIILVTQYEDQSDKADETYRTTLRATFRHDKVTASRTPSS